jgi:hypothetical protein
VNLNDLDTVSADGRVRLTGSVLDTTGESSYRLMVEGPEALVPATLGEPDIDVMVQPGGTREDWERRFAESLRAGQERRDPPETDLFEPLFKPTPDEPTMDNTVTLFLERLQPGATTIFLSFPFTVAMGANLFLVLPFVCSAAAFTVPTSGDPDLYLELSPFGPTVDSSTLGGTAIDLVSHSLPLCLPFAGFIPFCRVFGFRASSGRFTGGGYISP